MRVYKASFTAIGDDGENYVINIYVDIIPCGTLEDPEATIEGLRTLLTEDGLSVNRVTKGEYQIVQTGVRLRSDSPDAP